MTAKKAIVQIDHENVNLILIECKDNLYFNIIDVFSDSIPLVEDIDKNGILRPVLIKDLLKILKMYRRICDNNSITEIYSYSGSFFAEAKNNKSISEEIYNTCGFLLNILTPEDEMKNTFIGAVNSSDVQKGVYFYVGSRFCYLLNFNRRNILNSVIFPFGVFQVSKILNSEGDLQAKKQEISNLFNSYFSKADFVKSIDEETEILSSGNTMLSIGKIARKATRYPLEMENNYVLSLENFNNVYSLVEGLGLDNTKKIKGISSESADRVYAGAILAKFFVDGLGAKQVSISSDKLLDGLISTSVIPAINERPLSDMFIYSLENISAFFSGPNSNNNKVYELSINVFKQLKVVHKLPRNYIKPLRIAGYLYDCGKRINFDNAIKNSFEVILNSKIKGASQKEILLGAFACKLQDLDNFNLSEWVRYSSLVTEEDSVAVKKVGVLIQLSAALDASKSGAVDDLNCDILGDSIIVKTIVNKEADFEIKEAMKVNKNFKKVFTKFIEVI